LRCSNISISRKEELLRDISKLLVGCVDSTATKTAGRQAIDETAASELSFRDANLARSAKKSPIAPMTLIRNTVNRVRSAVGLFWPAEFGRSLSER
jgi:hypothetical protein